MTNKFQLGQRVNTPLGPGVIDTMPYNDTTHVYGVWLDKPQMMETSHGVVPNHWEPVPEKHITAVEPIKRNDYDSTRNYESVV